MSEASEELSSNSTRPGVVLTAIGPDRPGLVKELAAHLRKLGGNIEDTRMSKLGGEFAVLVLVTGEDAALGEISNSLGQLESALGVSCFLKKTSTGAPGTQGPCYSFRASGVDHKGIVESVTEVLASRGINVTSLSSRIENAPLTGTPMFLLDAEVELPEGVGYQELVSGLSEACEREDLEFSVERGASSSSS